VVESALEAINDPDTLAVLMTGRKELLFRDRIENLLNQVSACVGIHFPASEEYVQYNLCASICDHLSCVCVCARAICVCVCGVYVCVYVGGYA